MIQFYLNGLLYRINRTTSLQMLINYLDYNEDILVVEYNNAICNKKNWPNIIIQEIDMIEFITIVGGG